MPEHTETTHHPEVQASAAGFILQLQAAYPEIVSLNQTPAASETDSESASETNSESAASSSNENMAHQAQVSLLQYLASLISPEAKEEASEGASASTSTSFTKEDLEAVRQNPCFGALLKTTWAILFKMATSSQTSSDFHSGN